MKRLIILLIVITNTLYAQKNDVFEALTQTNKGTLFITQDSNLKMVLEDYIDKKANEKGLNGYRVQIFFGAGHNSRDNANKLRNDFVAKYPDLDVHIIFQEPYFKVRIGDFRNKTEALRILYQIKNEFEGAFIVKDYINFPNLESEEVEE